MKAFSVLVHSHCCSACSCQSDIINNTIHQNLKQHKSWLKKDFVAQTSLNVSLFLLHYHVDYMDTVIEKWHFMLIYSAFCWGSYTQDWGFALLMNTKWHAGFALQRLSKLSKHVQILILFVLSERACKEASCILYLTSLLQSQWGWAKPSLSQLQYCSLICIWLICCCTDVHHWGTAMCCEQFSLK